MTNRCAEWPGGHQKESPGVPIARFVSALAQSAPVRAGNPTTTAVQPTETVPRLRSFWIRRTALLVTHKVYPVAFSLLFTAKEWVCGVLRSSRKSLWFVALGDQERTEKESESPCV